MSALAINTNMLAVNTANNLTSHYNDLAQSTQRLSSGLRINSAADDAAGLAIRELMRADITALHQGVRNVNDAISMLQTFDGALAVIDEKLIRMKELAEQAATGTYDSTQRLMIDSEFQAMGEEINRIARATDFNGIKLLNGDGVADKAQGPGRKEEQGTDGRIWTTTLAQNIVASGAVTSANSAQQLVAGITDTEALGEGTHSITLSNNSSIAAGANGQYKMNVTYFGNDPNLVGQNLTIRYDPAQAGGDNSGWSIDGFTNAQLEVVGDATTGRFIFTDLAGAFGGASFRVDVTDAQGNPATVTEAINFTWTAASNSAPTFSLNVTSPTLTAANVTHTTTYDPNTRRLDVNIDLGNGNTIAQTYTLGANQSSNFESVTFNIDVKARDPGTPDPDAPDTSDENAPGGTGGIPDNVVKIHFGPMNDSAEDYYYVGKHDATLKGLGLDGVDIQTQDKAQHALVQIRDAIIAKDKIRADYGALQNRFENTMTNLTTQAENLQAAESRISDTDIAREMTIFVRNQILTNSAVAMLSQANSMPQMVMRLIGG